MRSSPDSRVYRGVLLGLGGIARSAHLPAFLADARVASRLRIVGIVDDAPWTGAGMTSFQGIPLLSSPDQLPTLGPIDFVDICTPTSSHLDLSLWALSQGYHVLCEKPVAVTRAEAVALATAASRVGRVVMPCHQYRFNPVWRRVKRWLDEGVIGRWYLAEFRVYRLAADQGASSDVVPWRGRRAGGRGGVLLDHGTHLVYELLDVAGPPQAVRAWTGRLRHGGYDVEDTAQILFDYPDRMATMFLTWAARRRETEVRFIGERGSITWSGGTLTLERDGNGPAESFDHSAELDKASYATWFADLFCDFAKALDSGDGAPHIADIARVAAVLEDAYAGAATPELQLA
ncbi:MAG TPA: Gfo/Idh/MocA family oxidoreductase [Gemmatimonadales bacterium]|nr:Gfo/Idh/MocA family oxidoreductase [Gemmatimonadales bacterium]